jgi:hypothetical protein
MALSPPKDFDSESFTFRLATVFRTTDSFLMCHEKKILQNYSAAAFGAGFSVLGSTSFFGAAFFAGALAVMPEISIEVKY